MSRRTITTIAVAALFAVFMGVLWWWFFGHGGAPAPSTGSFGSAGDRGSVTATTPGAAGSATNIQAGTVGAPGSGQSAGQVPQNVLGLSGSPVGTVPTFSGALGANWLAGAPPSGSTPNFSGGSGALGLGSGSGTDFTPAQINQLNNNQVSGDLYIPGQGSVSGGDSGSGSGLAIGLVAGTAVACSAFLVQGQVSGVLSSLASTQVPVNDSTNNTKSFMDCLMRTIARAALQQMTNSIVAWINSGFNGQPSFVTNYQQFFQSVADQAAGTFIANVANFAPFCTPFRAQIQIALAQSYARRNTAQSCTLSQLLGTNTQSLFSGKAGGGGSWSNFLQFTTVPANNPYGAYMSAQAGLQASISVAGTNAQRNISPGGFLNMQKVTSCKVSNGVGAGSVGQVVSSCPAGCTCSVQTPGSTIQDSLSKTLGVSVDNLNQAGISGSFDAIVNALITQLMQRALYNGLAGAAPPSYTFGQTFDQQTAQAQGQYLLSQLRTLVTVAQQYGQTKQGAISDIESSQQQLNTLYNCWVSAAKATSDGTKQQFAQTQASTASTTLHSFDAQIASLNASITTANSAIAALQAMQTQVLAAGSTSDVAAVQSQFDAAQSQGQVIQAADLTQSQQDRTTLQAQLGSLNQQTQTGLTQCYAYAQGGN